MYFKLHQLTKVLTSGMNKKNRAGISIFHNIPYFCIPFKTESVAQLVRASVCGTEGRGFETHRSPSKTYKLIPYRFF